MEQNVAMFCLFKGFYFFDKFGWKISTKLCSFKNMIVSRLYTIINNKKK